MEATTHAFVVLLFIVFFLGVGVWIFAGLVLVSFCSLYFIADMPVMKIGYIVKGIFWQSSSSWELACIPLFLWMGEFILKTDISERLFNGLRPLLAWIPGGLIHTNVMGCTLFAAISGSSAATVATVGKITVGKLAEDGYDDRLSIGSIAGAGTLGLLIPPSIIMIVYGLLAEVSIARLFAAGLVPGLMVALLYSLYIAISCIARPELGPKQKIKISASEYRRSFINLFPVLLMITIVLGGIYSGVATPSEAAALGLAAAFVIAAVQRQLTWQIFRDSLMASLRTSCMVISIVVAASFMSTAMAYLYVPQELAKAIAGLGLGTLGLLLVLFVFYAVLGCFLEGISIVVMSLPIVLPMVVAAGLDVIWFGVFVVITVELAQVTPPVGINLFVLQGFTGRSIGTIAVAAIPFFLLLCVAAVLISIWPQIVLWLPNLLYGA
ncbi:MAG: TRAP transporter large permease subunit [Rhodospirillales bacterium]|nr:TRAP transporter large permease subunit [Rhodospirillales bacterium]